MGLLLACDVNICGALISICKRTLKTVYDLFLEPILKIPAPQSSIPNMHNLVEIDWRKVYLSQCKVTLETSLGVFQYKILNNVLYLNNYKFGFADSLVCSLCAK